MQDFGAAVIEWAASAASIRDPVIQSSASGVPTGSKIVKEQYTEIVKTHPFEGLGLKSENWRPRKNCVHSSDREPKMPLPTFTMRPDVPSLPSAGPPESFKTYY